MCPLSLRGSLLQSSTQHGHAVSQEAPGKHEVCSCCGHSLVRMVSTPRYPRPANSSLLTHALWGPPHVWEQVACDLCGPSAPPPHGPGPLGRAQASPSSLGMFPLVWVVSLSFLSERIKETR